MRVSYLGSSESSSFISPNSIRIPLYTRTGQVSSVDSKKKSNTLVNNPATTFFVRAQGEPMPSIDINSGEVLVVDRSLTARHGDIVITCEKGKMKVVTLELKEDLLLRPKNKAYVPGASSVATVEASSLEVYGVVAGVVRPKS